MDVYQACELLAKDIEDHSFYDSAMFIQFFWGYLNDGDTPKMALSCARRDMSYCHENVQQ